MVSDAFGALADPWPRDLDVLPWTRRLRAMARGAVVLGCLASTIAVSVAGSRGWWQVVVLALVLLGAVLIAVGRAGVVASAALALAAGTAPFVPGLSAAAAGTVLGIFVYAQIVLVQRRMLPVVALVGSIPYLVSVASAGRDLANAIDDVVLSTLIATSISTFVAMFADAMSDADRQRDTDVGAAFVGTVRAEVLGAAEHARWILHDEILGLLRPVADGAPLDRERAIRYLERLRLLALGGASDGVPTPLVALVEEVARTTSLPLRLVVQQGARGAPPLSGIESAGLRRALGECLRNVDRHAGATEVIVTVAHRRDRYSVLVADNGRGLPPDHVPGWGSANSVSGEMSRLGGTATWSDRVGRSGCEVALEWTRPPAPETLETRPDPHRGISHLMGHRNIRLSRVLVPAMAAHVYIAARHSVGDPTGIAQLVLAAAVTLGIGALVRHCEVAPLRPRHVAMVGLAVTVAGWLGLVLAEPDALVGYDSWIVGMLSVACAAVAWFAPWYAVVLTSGPLLGVVGWAAFLRGPTDLNPTGAALAVLLPVTIALVAAYSLRWIAADGEREGARNAALVARVAVEELDVAHESRAMRRSVDGAVDWLQAVADGRLDATTASARAQAQRLCHEVRDGMYLSDVLDEPLLRRMSAARMRDVRVDVVPVSGRVIGGGAVLRAFDRALDVTAERGAVVLWLPSDTDPSWRLSVTPALGAAEAAAVARPFDEVDCVVTSNEFGTSVSGVIR